MSINDWNAVEKDGTLVLEPGLGADEPKSPPSIATLAQLQAAQKDVDKREEAITGREQTIAEREADLARREKELNAKLAALSE